MNTTTTTTAAADPPPLPVNSSSNGTQTETSANPTKHSGPDVDIIQRALDLDLTSYEAAHYWDASTMAPLNEASAVSII